MVNEKLLNMAEQKFQSAAEKITKGLIATCYKEQQTNADRIRAMSDEEIAKIFTSAVADGCPPKMDWDCAKDEYGWDACDACWCKWLKQPAKGE